MKIVSKVHVLAFSVEVPCVSVLCVCADISNMAEATQTEKKRERVGWKCRSGKGYTA